MSFAGISMAKNRAGARSSHCILCVYSGAYCGVRRDLIHVSMCFSEDMVRAAAAMAKIHNVPMMARWVLPMDVPTPKGIAVKATNVPNQ